MVSSIWLLDNSKVLPKKQLDCLIFISILSSYVIF